jgi:hypothetical protein
LQAKYEKSILERPSIFLATNQIELFVEIWQFFLNFGQILTIENLKKTPESSTF